MTSFASNGTLGTDFSSTTTSPEFAVGQTVLATDGGEWVYVKAAEAIDQYHSVAVTAAFLAYKLTNTNAVQDNFYASAQIAFAADAYGWVAKRLIGGYIRVKASCAKNVALYTTATAGELDDTATSIAFRIDGVQIETTNSAGGAGSKPGIVVFPNIIVPA